jgi:putative DNA primase/helicase
MVATYLRSRGITVPVPPKLRWHPGLLNKFSVSIWPAMVALVQSGISDEPIAIHRTYLARDGNGKAPIDREYQKLELGPAGGGAIRLAPVAEHLAIGEGIETCLSVMQETGLPVWSARNAVGLRGLDLPPTVRVVTMLIDRDNTGERAAIAAAARWQKEGREVRFARPPRGFKDFNDMLVGQLGGGVAP